MRATQTFPYAFTVRSSFKWHIKKISSAIEICYTCLKVSYLTRIHDHKPQNTKFPRFKVFIH